VSKIVIKRITIVDIGQGLLEKSRKKSGGRANPLTVRYPELISGFAERYQQLLDEARVTQLELAEQLGGFNYQTLSRIGRGHATGVPIDLMIRLLLWVDQHGFSVVWLLNGVGEIRKSTTEQVTPPGAITSLANITLMHMLLTVAARAKVRYDDLLDAEMAAAFGPGNKIVSMPLRQAINMLGLRVDEQYRDPIGDELRGAQEDLARAVSWSPEEQRELRSRVRAQLAKIEARRERRDETEWVSLSPEAAEVLDEGLRRIRKKRGASGSSKAG
jgi:hypothetical protein